MKLLRRRTSRARNELYRRFGICKLANAVQFVMNVLVRLSIINFSPQ